LDVDQLPPIVGASVGKTTPIHLWPDFTAKVVQQFDNSGFEASTKRVADICTEEQFGNCCRL
jgi:hypothetical protein